MSTNWNLVSLGDLGVLRFRGADAVRFLQGQVSNDVERLSAERSQLAGYHNPQGRVIALLRLVQLAPDDVVAVFPRELIATVAGRLGKFVLRAKVKIADDSAQWRVEGLVAPRGADGPGPVRRAASEARVAEPTGPVAADTAADKEKADTAAAFEARASSWATAQFEQARAAAATAGELSSAAAQLEQARAAAATAGELSSAAAQLEEAESVVPLPTASAVMLPDSVHGQSRSGGAVIVRVGAVPARWLVLSPAGEPAPLAGCDAAVRDVWRLLDIADGEAQVYAATSEEFVAQMLNLDALDAIAFDKGCYTGQEVIARAHYRGRVKRRLQRFVSKEAATLAIGESGTLADGRAFKVAEAVGLTDGRCEFLAVAPMQAAAEASAGGDTTAQTTRSAPVIDAEVLTLPYPLPE